MARVLIIEDENNLRELYLELFKNEGFEVEQAIDGAEGLEKIKSFTPDIVLLDILMPKMSGFDVLKSIKDNPEIPKVPVLVLTNIYTDKQDLVKNWGVSYVLMKVDYTPGDIVEKVRGMLGVA